MAEPATEPWRAPSLDDDFEDFLNGLADRPDSDVQAGVLEGIEDVHRMLCRIQRLDAAVAELSGFVEARKAEYDRFLRDRVAGPLAQRAELVRAIKSFARAHPKRPTLILPSGVIRSRPAPKRVMVTDPVALRDWAETADRLHFVNIKIDPDKTELAKLAAGNPVVFTMQAVAEQAGQDPRAAAAAAWELEWMKKHLGDEVPDVAVANLVDEGGEIVPGVFVVTPQAKNVTVTPAAHPGSTREETHTDD